MRCLIFILLILSGFAGVHASADEATSENKAYWLCKHRKEVRTIRVHIDDKNICATYYSKEGTEKVVGSGKNHESCLSFLNSIKANLEKSNWNCRDITDTKITSLE
ncbi:MAG: hypothetical protein ACXVA9_12605 [Bdellovibrionales bacterium]